MYAYVSTTGTNVVEWSIVVFECIHSGRTPMTYKIVQCIYSNTRALTGRHSQAGTPSDPNWNPPFGVPGPPTIYI